MRPSIDPVRYQQKLKHVSEASGWTSGDLALFAGLTNQVRFILVLDIYAYDESRWSFLYDVRHEPSSFYDGPYYPSYEVYDYNLP